MSSGFVSGGTAGEEVERDDEWKAAQRQIEEARKAKEDLAKQHDGKSLFEILEANKEKKQAEFEERARFQLHNALDDDEADYLDSVLEKKRTEEGRVRQETLEQLQLFRAQQEEAERKALEDEALEAPTEVPLQWAASGKKRKKGSEAGLLKGVKLMKPNQGGKYTSNDLARHTNAPSGHSEDDSSTTPSVAVVTAHAKSPFKPTKPLSLGLDYESSDDET